MHIFVVFLLFLCELSDILGHELDRSRKDLSLLKKLDSVAEENSALFSPFEESPLPIYEVCLAFLKEFGKNAGDFIKCSVEKARPFRFCESCVKEYERAITTFQDILQDDEKWSSCRQVLLKADRIQVLDTVYNNIKEVWQEAYCDGCFVSGSISEDKNGTVTYKYSDIAMRFNILFRNTTKCIQNYSNISIYEAMSLSGSQSFESGSQNACIACLGVYQELNSEFKDSMKKTNREVCMDLVDMMNYTRITWGLKLHCTKSHDTNAAIIIIAILVAGVTVAFYVVTGVKGSRKEKKLMKQKRMSVRSAAALYGTTEVHHDGLDNNADGLSFPRSVS